MPLQPIDEYAPIWLAALLVAVICWYAMGQLRHQRVIWVRPDSTYPGLEPFPADRARVVFGRDEESSPNLWAIQLAATRAGRRDDLARPRLARQAKP